MAGIVETKVRRKRIINSIVNHKKEIETLIYVICALVILWIFVSFIEVNMHNMTDHIYSKWNFFTLLIEIYNKIGRWFHMQTENTVKEIFFAISILMTLIYWIIIIIKRHVKPNKIFAPCIVLIYLLLYVFATNIFFVPCIGVNIFYWLIAGGMIYDELTQSTES